MQLFFLIEQMFDKEIFICYITISKILGVINA